MTGIVGVGLIEHEGVLHVIYHIRVDHPDDERRRMIGSWALARDRDSGEVDLYWMDQRFGNAKVAYKGTVLEAVKLLATKGRYVWHITVDPIQDHYDDQVTAVYFDSGQMGDHVLEGGDIEALIGMAAYLEK